jgi:quercetin dioxygenase-like cupin family protein
MAQEQQLKANGLPGMHRYITDHDADGKAIFSSRLPEPLPWQDIGIAQFSLAYATSHFPVSLDKGKDVSDYEGYLENKPGIVIPNGTVLRIVDTPPGSLSPMHRTVSLDYGVVLEGEIALELDSGETRIMRRGDISIQRGTNHAWRNLSKDKWARMLYVLQESEPVTLNDGQRLGEDYGSGMPGVKASGH